jgi:ADP-heptose:LPS heptosyltransferase
MRPRTSPGDRVLVVQLARFGDIIQSKRLLRSLTHQGAEAHLAVDESLTELARLVYPDAAVHGLPAHKTGLAPAEVYGRAERAFAELRGLDFNAVYNLNYSGLNFALANLFDPEITVGYRVENGQRLRDSWPAMVTRWSSRRRTAGLNLADFWGEFAPEPMPPGEVNPVAAPKGGGVGVVLAGRHSRRSLPPEILAPVVAAAAQGSGARRVVLLGGKSERKAAKEFHAVSPSGLAERTENLAGRTSYADLAEVVGSLDMLFTPDTGTMHLAAHLGTPVQALFLSSAWCFETGPYGLGHKVWQALQDCVPCLESAECPEGLKCREPFGDRDFLRYLAGSPEFDYPRGMLGLVSSFDELGADYRVVLGEDPYLKERRSFRGLVAEYLGRGRAQGEDAARAAALFQERDWMLEDRLRIREFPECT